MLFNSPVFPLFLAVVLLLYTLLRKSWRMQNGLLLVASYVFYAWWDWRFLGLILLSTAVDFLVGLGLQKRRSKLLVTVSVLTNLGILLGAFLAAGLAGRFAPQWRIPARTLLVALLGGILMGYGARLAFGCNIGALFSGIASGSLHGWLWMASALAGTALGVPLARRFLGRG